MYEIILQWMVRARKCMNRSRAYFVIYFWDQGIITKDLFPDIFDTYAFLQKSNIIILQLDRASVYFADILQDCLRVNFLRRFTQKNMTNRWPPSSPDFSIIWKMMCAAFGRTQTRITAITADITKDMSQSFWPEVHYRWWVCTDTNIPLNVRWLTSNNFFQPVCKMLLPFTNKILQTATSPLFAFVAKI
jgi:hypothetical protein